MGATEVHRASHGILMTAVLGLFLAAAALSAPLVHPTYITSVVGCETSSDAASVSGRLVNLS